MSTSSYQMVDDVEKRLDAATEMLAGLQWLTPAEANRIGARIDGLASRLAAVSPPDRDSAADDNNRAD
jgi:hypothetical protein